MKKTIALILSLALIISMATCAMAATSTSVNKTLTSTSVYVNACDSNPKKRLLHIHGMLHSMARPHLRES